MRPATPPDSTLKTAPAGEIFTKGDVLGRVGHEQQGSGFDPAAVGHELQGRASTPPVARNAPPGIGVPPPQEQPSQFAPAVVIPPGATRTFVPRTDAPPPERVERAGNVFDGGQITEIVKRLPVAATVDIGAPAEGGQPVTLAPLAAAFDEDTLVKADKLTLVISAEKDGKLRLGASSWENGKVILPGEELDVRWQAGQVVLVRRKPKAG